jgi:tRNA threonylcarbamoyladenosine biosynthesis protein TsaE
MSAVQNSSKRNQSQHASTVVLTQSASATEALGEKLGQACGGGEVIALVGPLGAGKTCLVRGIARGLGAATATVSSPTFALIHEYRGHIPIIHVDLYRLQPEDARHGLGLEEYLTSAAVTIVEWADKIEALLPRDHLRVELEHVDEHSRRISLIPSGASYRALLEQTLADWSAAGADPT